MPILLYRVDERLIHGQVIVGWGSVLSPDRLVVVDDDLVRSTWEQDLYSVGVPPEIEVVFQSVEGARNYLNEWQRESSGTIILTRDIRTMRRLAKGGQLHGEEINLGGIHFEPGRRALLPYLHLSAEDESELRLLAAEGVDLSARDLPNSRRVPLPELVPD